MDNVVVAESSGPMIVNFPDEYYANVNDNNTKKSNEFIPEDKFINKHGITILEEYTCITTMTNNE